MEIAIHQVGMALHQRRSRISIIGDSCGRVPHVSCDSVMFYRVAPGQWGLESIICRWVEKVEGIPGWGWLQGPRGS